MSHIPFPEPGTLGFAVEVTPIEDRSMLQDELTDRTRLSIVLKSLSRILDVF